MDDTALLRQTIRRCTAILVATITVTGMSLQRVSEASLLLIIAIGVFVYLFDDFVIQTPVDEESEDTYEGE